MNFLTPILETKVIILAASALWCLASAHLASHIYSRYFVRTPIHPLTIQCILQGFICLAMMPVMFPSPWAHAASWCQVISIPAGWWLGRRMVNVEIRINRRSRQKKIQESPTISESHACNRYLLHTRPPSSMQSLASSPAPRQAIYLKKLHEHYAAHESKIRDFSLVTAIAIAVFEEIIFRGYLVTLCLAFSARLGVTLLILTIVLFGLSHASFGWHQMVAKTILGSCCMAAMLAFGTILPAVIIHGYLNWCAHDATLYHGH